MKREESALQKGSLLYEGKAKKLYETTQDHVLWVEYKDEATAFNGEKKERIKGKGRLNNEISSLIFERLAQKGLHSHFVKKISETEQLVQETTILPLEVVVRNVVAGSLQKRTGLQEGQKIKQPIVECYYKNDDLSDPLVNDAHIRLLELATPGQVSQLKAQALVVNEELQHLFASCGLLLVDFKLEFGVTSEGKLLLADEISPDTCRLWDIDTNKKLDKDIFRHGLGSLQEAYKEILNRLGGAFHG